MEMFRTTRKKMSMLIGVLSAVAAMLICILVGWVIKPRWIAEEMESGGHIFRRKRLYSFMIRYAAPVIRTILFLQSTGIL